MDLGVDDDNQLSGEFQQQFDVHSGILLLISMRCPTQPLDPFCFVFDIHLRGMQHDNHSAGHEIWDGLK